MTAPWPETDAQENHEWLLQHFVQLLLAYKPTSVLDVGCGKGLMLKTLAQLGTNASGLDMAGPRLEELVAEGIDVREGSAYELPFDDNSVDWVTLRHVPHHLEDPARAFAEALRVSRSGVLLAEPYFDSSVPSQRGASLVDRWQKRQHRRRGMFHAEDIPLGPLLDLLPAGFDGQYSVEIEQRLRLRGRSIETFVAETPELLDDLPTDHEEHAALAQLLDELKTLGLSWNGSLCVALRRRWD